MFYIGCKDLNGWTDPARVHSQHPTIFSANNIGDVYQTEPRSKQLKVSSIIFIIWLQNLDLSPLKGL